MQAYTKLEVGAHLGSIFTEIGTIQRRLAWLLHKDDMEIHEAFHLFKSPIKKTTITKKESGKLKVKRHI